MVFGSVLFISISSLWRDNVYHLGDRERILRGPRAAVRRRSSGVAVLASDYWLYHKLLCDKG